MRAAVVVARFVATCVVLCGIWFAPLATAQVAEGKPVRPLTCHKEVCPVPLSPCEMLESDKCVRGRCPAIVPVPDGTACNLGTLCTTGDSCRSGTCTAGASLVCASPTATCIWYSGCATTCGTNGCTVEGGGTENPKMMVPAGALSGTVYITVTDLGPDQKDSSVYRVYQLGPDGTQFNTPATIDVPAPPLTGNQQAVLETSSDGTTWTPIATTLSNGRLSGPIAHFSFCRSRVITPVLTDGFHVLDMIGFPDVATATRPNGITVTACNVSDLYGFCATVRNDTQVYATTRRARVVGWACYNGTYTGYPTAWPPLDPNYEGAHCSQVFYTCTPDDVTLNFVTQSTPNGLAPGATAVVTINMYDNQLIPNTSACFFPSGMLFGVDLLFAEPTTTDPALGMRSAKNGPVVEVSPGSYVPYVGNYPVLKFRPDGSPVKNFLIDGRF